MVEAILDADRSSLFTPEEKAAIAVARELTEKAELSNAAFDRAARYFDERQLVELVVTVGVANLNNRVTDAFWADIEEAE
jgi:alkylhydroperoxidase family enzyme